MTSEVAFVECQWLSCLLRKSHCTRPCRRGSSGAISIIASSTKAWVSILSLYQSQPSFSGAQKVPSSSVVSERSMTASKTSFASSGRSDRKSTRLNSSHSQISYAVFCLKKKNITATSSIFTPTTTHKVFKNQSTNFSINNVS